MLKICNERVGLLTFYCSELENAALHASWLQYEAFYFDSVTVEYLGVIKYELWLLFFRKLCN